MLRNATWMTMLAMLLPAPPVRSPGPAPDLRVTGSLEVFVSLTTDALPAATTVENTTDPEVCGERHSLDDLVVSPENGGVRYAVVAISDPPAQSRRGDSPSRVELDNRGCRFVPHVAVVTVGDTVVAVNRDSTLHTVHYYGPLRGNLSLPRAGMTVARVARGPGLVSVLCDVHGWMKAFLRIDTHPFHGVTDETGRVLISDVPAGSHTLEVWHERLGTRQLPVQIEPGVTSGIEVVYTTVGGGD